MSEEAEVIDAQMVPVEQTRALTPIHRPVLTKEAIKAETEQRKLLGEFIKANMVEGEDYGIIPGTTKKTLLKPGAEKLIQLFYCTAKYTITSKIENYETGLFSYHFKCEILNGQGYVVSEGVGFCSSYESKYRWRSTNRICPHCGKDKIIKGKEEYGGGWLCHAKQGGCGQKFGDNDPQIINQSTEKEQNQDIVDVVNTVYKIGKKRSMTDATLALARCSDIFTQDMEDVAPVDTSPAGIRKQNAQDMKDGQARHAQQQAAKKVEPDKGRGEEIVDNDKRPKQEAPQQGGYQNLVCPKCGVKALGKSQFPPKGKPNDPPGFYCYPKGGGCKASFDHDDPSVVAKTTDGPASTGVDQVIIDWQKWSEQLTTTDVETFDKWWKTSKDDLMKISKQDRNRFMAIWEGIGAIADRLGWKYDKTTDSFVVKS